MKYKSNNIVIFLLVLIFSFYAGNITNAFSDQSIKEGGIVKSVGEYDISNDPRLDAARASFVKGHHYMRKGQKEFKRRAGLSQKYYEHAEDYLSKAAFLYKNLGEKNNIDVSHEIAVCERLDRMAHVRVNKARKNRRRKGQRL